MVQIILRCPIVAQIVVHIVVLVLSKLSSNCGPNYLPLFKQKLVCTMHMSSVVQMEMQRLAHFLAV